jgi:hypothetical protein
MMRKGPMMLPLFAQRSKTVTFLKDLVEENGWVVAIVVVVALAIPMVAAAVVGHRIGKRASSEETATVLGAFAGAVTGLHVLFLPIALFCLVRGEEILAKGPLSGGVVAAFIGLVSGGKYGQRAWKGMHGVQKENPDTSRATKLEKLKERVGRVAGEPCGSPAP